MGLSLVGIPFHWRRLFWRSAVARKLASSGAVAAPPVAYLDTGAFTAAATRTDAVDNGLYDIFVRNGASVEWQRKFVLDGSSTITGPSSGNITRAQYYGPLGLTPKTTGLYGPNLSYGVVFNSAGHAVYARNGNADFGLKTWATNGVVGASATSATRQSALLSDTDSHQGWCYAGTTSYVTAGTSTLKRWIRDAARGATDWTDSGVANASPFTGISNVGHLGAPCYRASNDRIYFTLSNYPTNTKAAIAAFDRTTLALIGYWPLADGAPNMALDGPSIDDTNGILYACDYLDSGTVRRYNLNAVEALPSGTSAESARLSDLVDARMGTMYTGSQGSTFKGGLIYTNTQRTVAGTGTMVSIRDATTGKWVGELTYTPTWGTAHEGIDWEGSELGVLIGGAGGNKVEFFQFVSAPTTAKAGLSLAGSHGIIFQGAPVSADYSVMTTAKLSSIASIAANGGKPVAWDNSGSSANHEGQLESTGALTVHANATALASVTGKITVNTLQTFGASYRNSDGTATSLVHSNNAASGTITGPTAGTPVAQAGSSFAGIASHYQNGRATGTIEQSLVFTSALAGTDMDALRQDYTLLWDATNGLSAGDKAAVQAAA